MGCVIEVEEIDDRDLPSYSSLRVFHVGCGSVPAKIYRNPATNGFRLTCGCGFEIVFKNTGGLAKIMQTAISGEQTALESADYLQAGSESIIVNRRSVARK